jgi:hypothetical protein
MINQKALNKLNELNELNDLQEGGFLANIGKAASNYLGHNRVSGGYHHDSGGIFDKIAGGVKKAFGGESLGDHISQNIQNMTSH